ncbi:MAG: type II secretion system protein [Desulfobacterium sp.]|nr:type II secretion system protein [Desulfobacterium sp.]MBU3949845.1 type II secretion system GspH family protein [Pseudomonadota bacterium]MBU4009491.1 type II secretion system GspH family protein [Pseudomonadota bacterium]MBU4035986.1 type II secretion system GspH family protein [Pseudomonadota bacterium]
MIFNKSNARSGFTLVEIIVTVVMVAIFSTLMLTLFSDSFIKSSDPAKRLLKSSDLSRVMANITVDYNQHPKWKALTDYATGNKILPVEMNGRFYICTSGGKSDTSEPLWNDYGNGKTYDSGVTWEAGAWVADKAYGLGDIVIPINPNGHFYRCVKAGQNNTEPVWLSTGNSVVGVGAQWVRLLGYLNLKIGPAGTAQDNAYGKYYVVLNRFVKFDSSNIIQPIGGGELENMLQVKITNDEGESLSALFTVKED